MTCMDDGSEEQVGVPGYSSVSRHVCVFVYPLWCVPWVAGRDVNVVYVCLGLQELVALVQGWGSGTAQLPQWVPYTCSFKSMDRGLWMASTKC